MNSESDELRLFRGIHEWSTQTFADERLPDVLAHLLHEVREELIPDPYEIDEYADVYLLLLDALAHAGFEYCALILAAQTKLEINKKRKWGKPNAQGFVEHLREPEAVDQADGATDH